MVAYAVAVRDGRDLLTVLTINRIRNNVYSNIPRPNLPGSKPHSSYHASGQHHPRIFGQKGFVRRRQRPDQHFRGTEIVENLLITPNNHRAINMPCQRSNFADIFEIPYDEMKSVKNGRLCVHLIERGGASTIPLPFPDAKIVRQKTFDDAVPWILVTLFDIG
jgi:hypothetical protein